MKNQIYVSTQAAGLYGNRAGVSPGNSHQSIRTHIRAMVGGLCMLALMLSGAIAAYGQAITGTTYPFSNAAGVMLEDMSSGTTELLGSGLDDNNSTLGSIGFDFWFNGTRYTQFGVNANGFARLGDAPTGTSFTNGIATTTNAPKIMPFWDDLCTGSNGKVHFKTIGTMPGRKLVVEWQNMKITRNGSCGQEGAGTFQVWLYESTGMIEFVYGNGMTGSNDGGYSIGLQAGASTNFASVTTSTSTCSYITANNGQTDAIAAGTQYTFTPVAPADPSGFSITSIGTQAMTLNWADNAANEVGYVIYRSTDGTNFTFINQTAAGVTSSVQTGLTSNTTYYWRIYAVSEGALSSFTGGNATTLIPVPFSGIKSVGTGGDYENLTIAFAAINENGLSGNVTLQLTAGYSPASETYPILSSNTSAVGAFTVQIYPVVSGLSITSNNATGTLLLNNAANIIFDGRVNAAGSAVDLVIENTATAGYTIRLANDAIGNIFQYCDIRGVNTSATSGVILFSTTTGIVGNDNNIIANCDIHDGATTPSNLIYNSGTASAANSGNSILSNNMYNFFSPTVASSGIRLTTGATEWTISSNKFYQTTNVTQTTGSIHAGIWFDNSSINNCVVNNNTIGYASSTGTGVYSFTGASSGRFYPIYSGSHGTTTASSYQGNVITAISVSGPLSGTSISAPFAGILILSGLANIGNIAGNTIGSNTTPNAISVSSSSTAASDVYGIYFFPSLAAAISNSFIGGMNLQNTSTGAIDFYGIRANTASTVVNQIQSNRVGFAAAPVVNGAAVSGSNTYGIYSQAGISMVNGNEISHLSMAGPNTGTNASAAMIGVWIDNTSASAGNTISGNSVHSLLHTDATAAVTITGLYYSGSSTGTHVIGRNFIHSLSLSSTSATASVFGMVAGAGIATWQNNMIRLGIDASGASITNANVIVGINKITTANNNFYHNSVYIGGSGVLDAAVNTLAFRRTSTGTDNIVNNIFANDRSNVSGAGKHYAIGLNATTSANVNNNAYYGAGNGFTQGYNGLPGTTDYATFELWRSGTGVDVNSLFSNPQFVNPGGTAATVDLHIHPTNPTAVESGGQVVSTVTDDFDGQSRAGLSPIDIGADAGDFESLDLSPPQIIYAPLLASCVTGDRTFTAAISDINGVPAEASGIEPRVYYSKDGGTNWFSQPGTLQSGDEFDGVWSFTIVAADMGGLSPGDVVSYYVVAQDEVSPTPNIGSNPAGVSAGTVTSHTPPATPLAFTILQQLNGVYEVGDGQDFNTLADAIAAYNTNCLTGPVVFELTDATYAIGTGVTINANAFASSVNTLTIRPATGVSTLISGSSSTALILLSGADYVIIDGSNSGGASKDLTTRNTNTSGATIRLLNDATNNTVKNTIIEGVATGTTNGTVHFSTSTGTAGNSNNLIENCDIRDRSDAAGVPANAVYSSGTGAAPNANNTISGCNIFNWTSAGVLVASAGAGNGWTINPSSFYQTANRATATTAISLQGGTDHLVSGNFIGGSAPMCGATAWVNTANMAFTGIAVGGTGTSASIQGNTIRNISLTGLGSYTFTGIQAGSNAVSIGTTSGNVIGDPDVAGSISVAGTGNVNGIFINGTTGAPAKQIANSLIANIHQSASSPGETLGIAVFGTGTVLISSNKVMDIGHTNPLAAYLVFGIYVEGASSGTVLYTLANNIVALGEGMSNGSWYFGIMDFAWPGNTVNTYFNSVRIGGTGTDESKTYAYYRGDVDNTTIRNNVFSNFRSGGTGFHVAIANFTDEITLPVGASDYNVFHNIDGTHLAQWGGDDAAANRTFAGWQASSGGDANSLNVMPLFVSATDLHLTPANGLIDGKGTPAGGITVDFDGDDRDAVAPDIGADEFESNTCVTATAGMVTPDGTTTLCGQGSRVLSSTGYSDGVGASFEWEISLDNFDTAGTPTGQTNPAAFNTGMITETTYFRLRAECETNMSTVYSNIIEITVVGLPSVTLSPEGPITHCPPEDDQELTVETNASAPGYVWKLDGNIIDGAATDEYLAVESGEYTVEVTDNATMCSAISTPVSVTFYEQPDAPVITADQDPVVLCLGEQAILLEATGGASSLTVTSGTGASTSAAQTTGSTLGPNPLQNFYGGAKQQWIYTAAELSTLGLMANSAITAISLDLATANTSLALQGLRVKMKNSATSSFSSLSSWEPGMTTVRTPVNYLPVVGLNTFTLDAPFIWDGVSNLVIEINYSNNNLPTSGANAARFTATGFVGTLFYRADNITSAAMDAYSGTGSFSYSARNDVTFDFVNPGNSLEWWPNGMGSGLFTDPGATVPYEGEPASQVYAFPGSTTMYTVTATNQGGCINEGSIEVMVSDGQLPTASLTPSGPIELCRPVPSVALSAMTSAVDPVFIWKKNGEIIDGVSTSSYAAETSGDYTVEISDAEFIECGSAVSNTVTVVFYEQPDAPGVAPDDATVCLDGDPVLLQSMPVPGGMATVTGSDPTTSASAFMPFYRLWEASRKQYMISAGELTALGLAAGKPVYSVSFNVTTAFSNNLHNFNIKIGHTSETDLSSAFVEGLALTYGPVSYSPAPGANTFVFDAPFIWDGVSNVVIEVCHNNDPDGTCIAGSPVCWGFSISFVSMATAPFAAASREIHDDNPTDEPEDPWDFCSFTTGFSSAAVSMTRPVMVLGVDTYPEYTWEPSSGLFVDAGATVPYEEGEPASQVYALPATTTVYTAVVSNDEGCTNETDVTVTVITTPLPTAPLSPSGPVDLCSPASSQLLSAAGTNAADPSFVWKKNGVVIDGATASTYLVTSSGSYTVEVTDAATAFCGFTASDPAVVTFHATPAAPVIMPDDVFLCPDDDAVLLTTSSTSSNGTGVATSGAISLSLPDNSSTGVSHTLNIAGIPAVATVDSIIVTVNVTHTFISDIEITLEAPNGQRVTLVADRGGAGDHFIDTRITSDISFPPFTNLATSAPFTGTFRYDGTTGGTILAIPPPTTSLFTDLFASPNGNWTLRVYDDGPNNTGTLLNWSVKVAYSVDFDFIWSPVTGLYTDAGATIPYAGGDATEVYALPGSTTIYSVTIESDAGCESSGTVEVKIGSSLVTNTNDTGDGSLRAAIDCTPDGGTITFAGALTGQTIGLDAEIVISKNLTITGLGAANLTISGGGDSRIFRLTGDNTLILSGITLADGDAGEAEGRLVKIEDEAILEVGDTVRLEE